MPNKHKDLPSGSQAWANELDQALETIKQLQEVVRRLSENAGLDYSNPKRGINPVRDIPSGENPVGQKLSSLADVQTYNVADKQVLSWAQKDQRWLPVTLPSPTAGGTIDISEVSYSGLSEGYGDVESPSGYAYTAAGSRPNPFGPSLQYAEVWATNNSYIGAGDWNNGDGNVLLELQADGSSSFLQMTANDNLNGVFSDFTLYPYKATLNGAYLVVRRCSTANRPQGLGTANSNRGAMVFDTDLNIPIWWNGTTWINAIGTAV